MKARTRTNRVRACVSAVSFFGAVCFAAATQGGGGGYPSLVDGVLTLTEPGEYAEAIPSGATKLVVDAKGEVTLSSATAYEGEVEICSGSTLKVPNLTTLANAPVTVKNGGTFYPTFECNGKSALLQPITLAGSGNGGIGAFKYGGPQNYKSDSLVGTLILTADATIDCSVRWGVSGNGKQGLIDLNGHTLTRIGTDGFILTSLTMTPGTFKIAGGYVTFCTNGNGGFGVAEGHTGDETQIVLDGGELGFWNTQHPVPYKLVYNGGWIHAANGNGSACNLITGPVEMNAVMKIEPKWTGSGKYSFGLMGPLTMGKALSLQTETLYLGGPIVPSTGDSLLYVHNRGLLNFAAEDAGTLMIGCQNGRVEFDSGRAQSSLFRIAQGQKKDGVGAFGAFHHKRGEITLQSDWDKPCVGEEAGSFGTYTFDAGRLCPSNSFYVGLNAGSRGFFRQRGGRINLLENAKTLWWQGLRIAGAADAQGYFVQTGGTNDLLSAYVGKEMKWHAYFGTDGATNLLFALSGADTVFKTDGFAFGCETKKTTGVIAVNDGASLKARRFGSMKATMYEGTDITLSLDGGVLCPLFHGGWSYIESGEAIFPTQRVPQHVVVGPKGAVIDTSDCVSSTGEPGNSQLPLTFTAPEGQGIASVELPADVKEMTYYGAVPVEIEGPAGSYGASAYGEWDAETKRLTGIVVTSAGCNYDDTTKIYVQGPTSSATRYECAYTLTGEQASGPLVKRGANGVTLYGANTCTGGTVVAGGTLTLAASASIPSNTPLKVMDGATFDNGGKELTVSTLAGAGGLVTNCADKLTVTKAVEISAAELFAASGPLTVDGTVTFGDGVVVRVTDAESLPTDQEVRSRPFLKATGGFAGAVPTLRLEDATGRGWKVFRSGKTLRFGPERGVVVIIR